MIWKTVKLLNGLESFFLGRAKKIKFLVTYETFINRWRVERGKRVWEIDDTISGMRRRREEVGTRRDKMRHHNSRRCSSAIPETTQKLMVFRPQRLMSSDIPSAFRDDFFPIFPLRTRSSPAEFQPICSAIQHATGPRMEQLRQLRCFSTGKQHTHTKKLHLFLCQPTAVIAFFFVSPGPTQQLCVVA